MAYKITDECISCGACEPECQCVGDFESPKCVEICPVDCCVLDPDHEESREALLEKWKKSHPGESPAVT